MKAKAHSEAKKKAILWLDMGWPAHRIEQGLWDLFEATPPETAEILQEIRHEHSKSQNVERAAYVAQQMTRLEALAVKAQEEGNLAVALGCYKELHALAKLT